MHYIIICHEVQLKARIDDLETQESLKALANNPCPHGAIKLQSYENRYRIRVGDYRIIYEIWDNILVVVVTATCGQAFTSSLGHDALDEAYREYRRRHNLLQPEEIRNWREQYGLTQKEFNSLLGWKERTLSKYENGALQEESQDILLKFALKPINLLQLIKRKPEAVNSDKRATLIEQLSSNQSLEKHLDYLYAAWGNRRSEANDNNLLDSNKKQILKMVNKSPLATNNTL
ncbi:type II toxin-antitoxin system MqsA family antitoxin [Candidatus Marithrix sp. Canyon 246]|uniref:type II toxin-antitoxin system MqsA family antitoxin n=1 Tax=Candidatus Marithrix sp. Canyon 246 TaxID=1827136 RepID=UPI00084A13E6|nr:type II toxin-antitoxin system MqsA family antitoxin [Candidatus Marithrix sp. Canyon 246]